MKKTIVIFSLLSLVTGCMSPDEREQKLIESKRRLIENPESMCRFTVNKNYQELYRIVKAELKDCEGEFLGTRTKLNAELHTDIEQGVLTTQNLGRFGGVDTLLHIEIKALSAEMSEYTSYSQFKGGPDCAEFKQFCEKY